jgi:coenzyme F420-reducing hydrogenase beta subunit
MTSDNWVCYGCGICADICKYSAISIEISDDGFWLPKKDNNKCVNCGLCEKSCSSLYNNVIEQHNKISIGTYSFITGDSALLSLVSSGGAAYEIGTILLNKGYKVLGVVYDYQRDIAAHTVISSEEKLKNTAGSKYIQSYSVDAFKNISKNEKYLVFGCPCYIDSFRRYSIINNIEDNFIFVDFFCHGVPSYHLWKKYIDFHIKKDEHIENLIFRDKRNGWGVYTMTMTMTMTNGRVYSKSLKKNDYFLNIFLSNAVLNKPCYSCKFRGFNSAADVRIGDLWGKKYENNKTGVSGIVVFSENGKEIIEQLPCRGSLCEENIETLLEGQIIKNIAIPKNRDRLLNLLKSDIFLPLLYYLFFYRRWMKNIIPNKIIKKAKVLFKR